MALKFIENYGPVVKNANSGNVAMTYISDKFVNIETDATTLTLPTDLRILYVKVTNTHESTSTVVTFPKITVSAAAAGAATMAYAAEGTVTITHGASCIFIRSFAATEETAIAWISGPVA